MNNDDNMALMSENKPSVRAGARRVLCRVLVVFLVLVAVVQVRAAAVLTNLASVTLAWDRSTGDFLTNGVTYRVYATNTSFASAVTNASAGTNTGVIFTNLPVGTWKFYAVAIQANLESLPSNTSFYIVPTNAPPPPGKFATVYLENENVLTVTNWTDLGMFRARIYIP